MAIPEKVDEFTFAGGLQQHEDHWLQASGFTRLENCVQDKAGALVKLRGYSSFAATAINRIEGPGANVSGAPKLISRGDQLGCVANGYVYSKQDTWVLQGRCSPWVAEQRTVVDLAPSKAASETTHRETVAHDCCRSGDWAFSAFQYWGPGDAVENSRICVVCTYLPTGTTVYQMVTDAEAYGINRPRIVAWDNTGAALLVYRREQNPADDWKLICYRKVTPGTLGAEVDTGLTCTVFDAASDPVAARAWIGYHPADGSSSTDAEVVLQEYAIGASTLAPGSDEAVTTTGLPRAVAVSGLHAANRVCMAYAQTVDVGGGVLIDEAQAFCRQSSSLATQVWPTLPATSLVLFASANFISVFDSPDYRVVLLAAVDLGATDGTYFLLHDPNGEQALYGGEFTTTAPTTRGLLISPTGLVGTGQLAGRLRMRTRPFFDGTRVCFLAEHAPATLASDRNRYYALMAVEPFGAPPPTRFKPVGHFAEGQATRMGWNAQTDIEGYRVCSTPYQDAGGAWHLQALERDPGTLRLRLRAYKLMADDRVGVAAELGGQTYLAGALLTAWDGLRCLEAGWLSEPVIEQIQQVPTGGLSAGIRYYALTYARTNAAGELLRSRPSQVVEAEAEAGELSRMRLSPYCCTHRVQSDHIDFWLEVWRTKVGQSSPFWLVARIQLDPDDRRTLFYDEDAADADIPGLFGQSLPFEEVPGAELANDPPISPVHLCVWRNRLWLTDGEQIGYSKEGVPSRAGEFSLLQTIPRSTQQRLSAVAPLGDVLAVFTEDGTAYVYGDGPAANGSGATLTGPVELHTEHGCTQPAGLCVTPQGLLVPTRRGLQLLTLGRSYENVGLAIERTSALFPRVRDADWQRGADRVWAVLSNAAGTESLFVVWDHLHHTWSHCFEGFDPASVRSVGDSHHWTDVAGLTRDETTVNSYRIGETAEYRQRIETVWFKPGGALAEIRFKRAWLLAQNIGASGLEISVGYDFEEEYTHVATFTDAAISDLEGGDNGILVLRVPAPRQRCHAFRLLLEETVEPTFDSDGFRFVAMRLLTALRGAKGPLKATRNAGTGFVSE